MKKKGNFLIVIGIILILVSTILMNLKKEYLFQEYGYGCSNVENSVSSFFVLKEEKKVYFNLYSKVKGNMSVSIKDSSGNVIFKSDKVNFKEKFSKELKAGTYYYDINYRDVDGDFEIYAVVRTAFGINY